MDTAGLPFSRLSVSMLAAPSSTRAMSRQAQHGPVRIGADHDLAELFRRDQAPLRLHIELELGRVAGRARADTAHCRLHVLLLDRRDDIRRRQIQADQPVHVEPNAHRIIQPAEQLRIAHTGRARQPVQAR